MTQLERSTQQSLETSLSQTATDLQSDWVKTRKEKKSQLLFLEKEIKRLIISITYHNHTIETQTKLIANAERNRTAAPDNAEHTKTLLTKKLTRLLEAIKLLDKGLNIE